MIERQVSTNSVVRNTAWAATIALYLAAGAVMLIGHWQGAIFIAEVACGASAYAAVRHLRCYASRICDKIDETALERDIARVTTLPPQRVR